ncbi:MAG TPA: phosphoribosyltransferase family protein [Bryobacteraceae bacterium]|nr:phosphoribosyltransferase family protein [Bryobacteraceae bacterium]
MQIIPTQDEVLTVLQETGALREGNFVYPNGLYSDQYLQIPLAFRYYQHARTLSVALSRKVRANPELRAIIPELSVVAPATGGLPVAFGVCEALRAKQVYWAERMNDGEPLRLRQFLEIQPGEKVLLVDDILRTGAKLTELKAMVEAAGAEVVAIAVIVAQMAPGCPDFAPLPVYWLAELDPLNLLDGSAGQLSYPDRPVEKIWI